MEKSMLPTNVIPALVEAVKQTEAETWGAFRDGDLLQEPKITSALGRNIKIRCKDIFKKMGLNIEVTLKDISDRAGYSEEPLYGATWVLRFELFKQKYEYIFKSKISLNTIKVPLQLFKRGNRRFA